MIELACSALKKVDADWSSFRFLLCDERMVPTSCADHTLTLYKKALLGSVPVKEEQFLAVNTTATGNSFENSFF